MNQQVDFYFYETKNNGPKIYLEKHDELPLIGAKTIKLRTSRNGNLIIQELKNIETL